MKGAPHHLTDIEQAFVEAAIDAGREIMAALQTSLAMNHKADGSPVTNADLRAEDAIRRRLGEALPGVPIIGEERGGSITEEAPPERFILVDPLDGTRDFIAGSPDFTVNIALIESGRAVAGVVYAPAAGRLFAGTAGGGAWEMGVGADSILPDMVPRRQVRVRKIPGSGPLVLQSRSHREPETEALLATFDAAARRAVGSSLKFALIAAGEGDLYVRGVSLNEWDIAAGDAVLTAAGGAVLTFGDEPIRYGRAAVMKAPPFIAIGDRDLRRSLGRLLEASARGRDIGDAATGY